MGLIPKQQLVIKPKQAAHLRNAKNKEKILKFTDSVKMSEGLKIRKYLQSVHTCKFK